MIKTRNNVKENFDRVVEKNANGLFTMPSSGRFENFKVRGAVEYCNKNNKDISKLSDAEVEQFMK